MSYNRLVPMVRSVPGLPTKTPDMFKALVNERNCRLLKLSKTAFRSSKCIIVNLKNYRLSSLPPLFNSLYLCKRIKQTPIVVMVQSKPSGRTCEEILGNLCTHYQLDLSLVTCFDNDEADLKKMNVVDFLCENTDDFSLRLFEDQFRVPRDGQSNPETIINNEKLTNILMRMQNVLQWEYVHNKYDAHVMLASAGAENLKVLEHVVNRGNIHNPHVLEDDDAHQNAKPKDLLNLDVSAVSAYELFQLCYKISDENIRSFLNNFSLMSPQEVDDIMATHLINPSLYHAHEMLAKNLLHFVNSDVDSCKQARECLRTLRLRTYPDDKDFELLEKVIPTVTLKRVQGTLRLIDVFELIRKENPNLRKIIEIFIAQIVGQSTSGTRVYNAVTQRSVAINGEFSMEKDVVNGRTLLLMKANIIRHAIIIKWCDN